MADGRGGPRPGAGRKPKPDKAKLRSLKATDDEWLSIQANAHLAGMSANAWLRRCASDTNLIIIYDLALRAFDEGELSEIHDGYLGELARFIKYSRDSIRIIRE